MHKALALFALGIGLGIACYCMQDVFLEVDDDPMDKGRGSRKGRGSGKGAEFWDRCEECGRTQRMRDNDLNEGRMFSCHDCDSDDSDNNNDNNGKGMGKAMACAGTRAWAGQGQQHHQHHGWVPITM